MGALTSGKLLSIEGLSLSLGGRAILRDIKLGLDSGEAVGLVGESGSGKSTLLRAIIGLVSHWDGEISILGETVRGEQRPKWLRRAVQMVFQDPYGSLHPRHSVERILTEPVRLAGEVPEPSHVLAALHDVGLRSEHLRRLPHQLSGGQRQRVAIARALIVNPRLLLLDEPTSALDVSVQAEILNLLWRLRKERNLAWLLVSHNLAVTAHMCDRIHIMANGRIVEALSHADLKAGRARTEPGKTLIGAALHWK